MTVRGRRKEYTVCGAALLLSTLSASRPVRADSVEVKCALMSLLERAELQARARLLLSSAGMGAASVTVGCDETGAWVVLGGGPPAMFATEGSLVEAALDAIEAQLGANRLPPANGSAPPTPPPPPSPAPPPALLAPPAPSAIEPSPWSGEETASPSEGDRPDRDRLTTPRRATWDIDGGVGLAMVTERWSGALGVGPRLDIGVGLGRRWSVVVAEGARFATAGSGSAGLLFDLQAGLAYGAPYAIRSGFGAVALLGAERQASVGQGGLWVWSFTGSFGLRASLAAGPVDVWLGVDAMGRSDTIDSARERVPNVTGLLSLGCLVPAFSNAGLFHAAAARGARESPRRAEVD